MSRTTWTKLCSSILPLLVLAACGHKAQVRAPQPSVTAPTTPQAQPAQPQAPPPPKPVVTEAIPPPEPIIPESVPSYPVPSLVPPSPPIRIGLATAGKEVRISAPGTYYLLEKKPEAQRELLSGEVRVRVEQEVDESAEVFRIQVASFARPEGADTLTRELEQKFGLPVVVRDSSAGLKQVRVGAFATREEALKFARADLADAGYRDVLVVRETTSSGGGEMRLALRGSQGLFHVSKTGFLFFPGSATAPLQLDGKPYRGLLDLTLNATSQITSVNQLGMEEYLLGVVPAEISPTAYPEFAALAAQAVAARTYALKNTGRFRSLGFDLTADTRSQVYTGLSGENDAANEAVRQTFGLAIYYQGKLIDAMYTSTCGGRTEDYAKVFDEPDVPYLRSVICAVESGENGGLDTEISGKHEWNQPLFADDGSLANRALALACVLGLAPTSAPAAWFSEATDAEQARAWIARALSFAGKIPNESRPVENITTRGGFLKQAVESFFGSTEVSRRISPADVEYYLGNLRDGKEIPDTARAAFAYVIQAGLWHPYPDNSARPKDALRRVDALWLLMRWLESAQAEVLRKGVFVGPGAPSRATNGSAAISIKSGRQTLEFPLAPDLRLYRIADGRSISVDTIKVIGNEKLSYHVGRDGKIDFLEVELNPAGASSDRYSPVATWQTTLSRATISEKLRPLAAAAGEFRDLKPSRFGTSGRAVQIQVVGTKGSVLLNGFKVRSALGLRDTLFTIERTKNPEGLIESFIFRGRGWGHGVGLCQVGAYGMARAGRSFEQILKTYYTGVEIKKAY